VQITAVLAGAILKDKNLKLIASGWQQAYCIHHQGFFEKGHPARINRVYRDGASDPVQQVFREPITCPSNLTIPIFQAAFAQVEAILQIPCR